jgi:dTDP-4-amino-4,6-dideoxygalactose transaminase
MIPDFRPSFSERTRANILRDMEGLLTSGQLSYIRSTFDLVPHPDSFTGKLERQWADICGVPHAAALTNCTSCLTHCLKYVDVTGHDVLVPSGAFLTDATSVIAAGGRPVLVDMNPETLSFDVADLERKLTPKTKAVMWLHLLGIISPEHAQIIDFAKRHGLFLIEDCAHAHGAEADGLRAGGIGDAGCFSFFASKVITGGTGGLITTKHDALCKYAQEMRMGGRDLKTGQWVYMQTETPPMDEIRACVAYHHSTELAEQVKTRRALVAQYHEALHAVPGVSLIRVPAGNHPAWYQFAVLLDRRVDRPKLMAAMRQSHSISTRPIYPAIHKIPPLRYLDDGTLEKTADVFDRSLCLPLFVSMTGSDIETIVKALATELKAFL